MTIWVADNQIGSLDALSLCGHHYPLTIVNTYKPLSNIEVYMYSLTTVTNDV